MRFALFALVLLVVALVAVEGRPALTRQEVLRDALFSQGPSIDTYFPTLFGASKNGEGSSHSKIFNEGMCDPGKTCKGLVVQLFFSPTCDWTQTAGFVEFNEIPAETHDELCHSGPAPAFSFQAKFDNKTNFWTWAQYPNDRCEGPSVSSQSIKTGVCVFNNRPFVFWNNASVAHPLRNGADIPQPVADDVPSIPDGNEQCYDIPNPPAGSQACNPKYTIDTTVSQLTPSSKPECPAPSDDNASYYVHGTGLPYKCYLDGFNTWLIPGQNNYTIIKSAGCNTNNIVTSWSVNYGCNWDSQEHDGTTTRAVKAGTLTF